MSEDEHRRTGNEEAGDEVESHRRHLLANEEPAKESEDGDDDDVEAHARRS